MTETPKVPEPALVRGGIVAAIQLVTMLIGREINPDIVEPLMVLYGLASPMVLAWWIRRNVSPAPKTPPEGFFHP